MGSFKMIRLGATKTTGCIMVDSHPFVVVELHIQVERIAEKRKSRYVLSCAYNVSRVVHQTMVDEEAVKQYGITIYDHK